MRPRTRRARRGWLAALAGLALLAAAAGPREAALLRALGRVHPNPSDACRATLRSGPRSLPRAEDLAELGSLHWPRFDGPRQTLLDRVNAELDRRDPSGLCRRRAPGPGGEVRHPAGFRLRVPEAWRTHAGTDWLLARAPDRSMAVEVVSFPSVHSPRVVAARSRGLLQEQRRVEAEIHEERAHRIGEREAYTLRLTFRARGREVPVRATWVRLGDRLARVMGVAEIEARWEAPELLESIEASLEPLRALDQPRLTPDSAHAYPARVPEKYLYVEGAATFLRHRGATTLPEVAPDTRSGEVVLCLHGAGGNSGSFDGVLDALADGHSPLALDLPAHGRSAGLDSLGSIDAMARFVRGVVDKLGLRPPVLLGHSMGGQIALSYALENPVRGLVLVGEAPRGTLPAEVLELWRRVSEGKERRPFPRPSFGPNASPELLRRAFMEFIKTDPRATYGDLQALNAFDASGRLGEIRVPCLVAVGEHDGLMAGPSEELARGIPGASRVVIPDAGHDVPLEQPRALAEAVATFLSELPA